MVFVGFGLASISSILWDVSCWGDCWEAEDEKMLEKAEKKKAKEQEKAEKAAKPKSNRGRKKPAPEKTPEPAGASTDNNETGGDNTKHDKTATAQPRKRQRSKGPEQSIPADAEKPKSRKKKQTGESGDKPKADTKADTDMNHNVDSDKPDEPPAPTTKDAEKAKRRERAAKSLTLLKSCNISDIQVPPDFGDRVSFTVTDPDQCGASIYVVLASSNFFVTKAVDKSLWPAACTHLKVHQACFLFDNCFQLKHVCSLPLLSNHFFQFHMPGR